MDRRSVLLAIPSAILLASNAPAALAWGRKKGVMLMNRIGPSASELFIANADGTDERELLQNPVFDYHASFSADGQWIVFTSEREGLGQADIYRARVDGSGIERLTSDPHVDDQAAFSPDALQIAFVSTRGSLRANIWVLDIKSGKLHNLTDRPGIQGDLEKPDGFFRPSWSPDGQWIAFSSDRNSEWRGHDNGYGWEHTQELSIYVIQPDGRGFRSIASKPGYCLGSPKWSPDSKRVAFYETTVEETWGARRPEGLPKVSSQIVSVDIETGARTEHTSGPGFKVAPQFLNAQDLAYHIKGGPLEGLYYTSGQPMVKVSLRSPRWSPDGLKLIYEKVSFKPRPQNLPLYSWDPDWDYQYTDVFPALSRDGKLVFTEKSQDSSILISDPNGSNRRRVFETSASSLNAVMVSHGLAGAFQPAWSPDGQWIAFGLGQWFQMRRTGTAKIMRVRRDGTGLEELTDGAVNAGFPSYSADGKRIVYRVWDANEKGLRIIDLADRKIQVLTTEADNLPDWSPDGSRIVFTRRVDAVNFDIFTIRPDGTDLRRLTTSPANDGHAVWTADGTHILWNSGAYGFRDEAALYDNTFQPYGQNWIMNADGSGKRMITDSPWEDSMPLYIPRKYIS
jgi:Tol biopolymer transport system component